MFVMFKSGDTISAIASKYKAGADDVIAFNNLADQDDIYIGDWGPDYMDPHTNADAFARNPDNADDAKSKSLAWRNAWDIPEMTQKADAAVLERNTAKRARMYLDLQREHQQCSPFVIMFQKIEVVAEKANVNNFILGPSFDSNFYQYTTK